MKSSWKLLLITVTLVVAVKLLVFPEASEFSRFVEVLTTVAFVALVIGIIGLVVAASYLRLTMPPGDRMDRLYRAATGLNRLILVLGPILFLAVVAYVKLYQVTG